MLRKSTILMCLSIFGACVMCLGATKFNANTAENEAILIRAVSDPKLGGKTITRAWTWLAAQTGSTTNDVQDLFEDAIIPTAYTNIQVNTHTFTGVFVNAAIRAIDDNEVGIRDRSCSIVQDLKQVWVVTNLTDYTNFGGRVVKNEDEEILNYLQFNEGTNQNIWHVYANLAPWRRGVVQSFNPTESGYRIIKKEFRTESDNTGTFIVTFETNRWINFSGNFGVQTNEMREQNYDPINTVTGITWRQALMIDGLYKDIAEAVRDNSGADDGWWLDDVTLTERANGEYAIIIEQTKQRTTNDYIVESFASDQGRQQETEVIKWYWLSESDADTLVSNAKANEADMTSAWPASPAQHDLKVIQKSPNQNGSFNVTRVTFKPNNTGAAVWPESAGRNYTNFYVANIQSASLRNSTGLTDVVKFSIYGDVYQYYDSLNDAWDDVANPITNVYIRPARIRRVGSGKYQTTITYRLPVGQVVSNISLKAIGGIANDIWVITNETWGASPWPDL